MTTPNDTPKRGGGIGCQCHATGQNECGCEDADWTDPEIYKLRDELATAIQQRNQYRDIARELAESCDASYSASLRYALQRLEALEKSASQDTIPD